MIEEIKKDADTRMHKSVEALKVDKARRDVRVKISNHFFWYLPH